MRDDDQKKAAISSSHSPPPPSSGPGLFSRLLKRGKAATKTNKPSRWSIGADLHYVSLPPEPSDSSGLGEHPRDTGVHGAVTPPPQRPKTAPGFRTGDTSPPNADTGASSGNGRASTSDRLMLSRRPTLRARLRFRATSNPQADAQATPRTIYVPTHAAADFSRMVVSPRYANGPDGNGLGRLEPIKSAEDLVEDNIKGARPLPVDDGEEIRKAVFEAKAPIEARRVEDTRPARRSLDVPRSAAVPDAEQQNGGGQSPSDFQLFLAQAEAEDRAQRIQIWRSISSAARGPPSNQYHPPPLDEIPEAEPRISNGTTAVASRPKRDNSYAARYGKRATWDSAYSSNYMYDGAAPKPSGLGSRTRASSDMPGSGLAATNARAPGFVGASSGINYDARQPRGLTRQSSLVKKVADYIRPPRDDSRTGSRVSTKSD